MPDVTLPSSIKGWAVALAASLAGLLAGLLTIRLLGGWLG
jgi:hypothetical protein